MPTARFVLRARWAWGIVFVLVLVLAFVFPWRGIWAASYTVTTLADNAIDDGQCSLREAIAAANNAPLNDDCGPGSPGDDTITFAVSGTIYLQSTLPQIAASGTAGALTIDGGNAITISGDSDNDGTGDVRLFHLDSYSQLTLQRLVLTRGRVTGNDDGAAVYGYNANLVLSDCTIEKHQSDDTGGAIALFTNGDNTFTARNCVFRNNRATWGGGAVYVSDMVTTISGSEFTSNQTDHGGGALYATGGSSEITDTTFTSNQAGGTASDGGAVQFRSGHTATVRNTVFRGNQATGNGGGVYAVDASQTLTDVTFDNNRASDGGGLYHWDSDPTDANVAALDVTNTIFQNNEASLYGGGVYLWKATSAVFRKTTWKGNRAWRGAGLYQTGSDTQTTVGNSTFSSNDTGAVYLDEGRWQAVNTTIAENTGSGTRAGGVHIDSAASATVTNTILHQNSNGNCNTAPTDGGHNIASDASCGFTAATSRNNTDARLGTITGSPAYYPLQAGSPALDAGNPTACAAAPVNNDSQNGLTRPQDGDGDGTAVCDIGSYEAPAPGTPTPTATPGPTSTPTPTPTPTATATPTPTSTPAVGNPPQGQLTADTSAWPLVTWQATWANTQNNLALDVRIVQPIPANSAYVAGSLACTPGGSTVITRCAYNAAQNRIEVEARLGPDLGGTFAAWPPAPQPMAAFAPAATGYDTTVAHSPAVPLRPHAALAHPLTIRFQTRAAAGVTYIVGQGLAYWDENNDGLVDSNDANVRNDTPVRTDDPARPGPEDPTIARLPALPETGFPPGRRAAQPSRVPAASTTDPAEVWVEIPRLQTRARVWGVAPGDDLAWLSEVGWLWSSAFPGHTGNSVLTAHNYLATGLPGPFAALHRLRYGDVVRVHAYGTVYEFAVTQVTYVDPADGRPLRPVDDGHAWLTLITCAQWDDADQAYRYRVVVRAVLVRWYQQSG